MAKASPTRRIDGAVLSDRRGLARSIVPPPISDRRVTVGRLGIVVTVVAWCAYFGTWLFTDLLNSNHSTAVDRAESIGYLLIVSLLTASSLAYLLSRLGFFYRARSHHRALRRELEEFFDSSIPTLTAIVPSYQEDTRVVRNTLLSAALQEYSEKRIVLLIDDPPGPRRRHAQQLLQGARSLPREIERLLAGPAAQSSRALEEFEDGLRDGLALDETAMARLVESYEAASAWLRDLASRSEIVDHTDTFLVEEVLLRLAGDFSTVGEAVREAARQEVILPPARIRQLYRRLTWTFRVEVTSFERKRFVSLSAEPNKASNLNSYIGLMGGSFREIRTPSGLALVPSNESEADLVVPNPDYVLTLDADSILLPEYCLRLVHVLEQSESRDVAIAQTPYSAFPGAASRLERIAGATTDLQHIVHQGLTYYNATFWVGANAVIRKVALDQIVETAYLGNWEIRQYIRDRTVIEDTESTIDLGIHGWKLYNYPERLSYSATPPDFGSLCIQRRRWANGGLLILSKLHRQARARRAGGNRVRFGERFLRTNYMASICWSSVSLLVLLVFPFNSTLINPLLGLVALPYFIAMASDLRYCGYKRLDIARVYGFNLILVPVNLAGTASSLAQGLTASKSAFIRTPKVRDRTVTPALFLVAPYLLIALCGYTLWVAYEHGLKENMAYAGLNILMTLYAIAAFIGVRSSLVDAWVHFKSLLYKRERTTRRRFLPANVEPVAQLPIDWQEVLQVGPAYSRRWANSTNASIVGLGNGRWQLIGQSADQGGDEISAVDVVGVLDDPERRVAALPFDDVQVPITFHTVFQPIVELSSSHVVGFEARSRFDGVTPEEYLAKTQGLHASTTLEGALARAAIEAVARLPKGGLIAIKTSFALLSEDAKLLKSLEELDRSVIVELPLPAAEEHVESLLRQPLPANVRLALEEVALEYSATTIVSSLRPALVKLQVGAVSGIAFNRERQMQVRAMLAVLREFRCELLAAGIETSEDLNVLRGLGVRLGQGFFLGRPQELVNT